MEIVNYVFSRDNLNKGIFLLFKLKINIFV